jgi:hypothetical protein
MRNTSSLSTHAAGVGIAVALALSAYIHLTGASYEDPRLGGAISEGNLFRAEAVVTAVLAMVVLFHPSRRSFIASLVVSAGALIAVLLTRYVNVGAVGPFPNLYEPTWDVPGKVLSAFAEAAAMGLSAAGIVLTRARGCGIARQRSVRVDSSAMGVARYGDM